MKEENLSRIGSRSFLKEKGPNLVTKKQLRVKRAFDLVITFPLLLIFLVPILILVGIATIETRKFGLYAQCRVGQHGRLFKVYKIRTMSAKGHIPFTEVPNNTKPFGKWLQKHKLNELPQLINVLFGSMSLVGPRPDLPGYADKLEGEDRVVLAVKPGITGPATVKFKNEAELLNKQANPQRYNDEVIWPKKVNINKQYVKNWSLKEDINILIKTMHSFF